MKTLKIEINCEDNTCGKCEYNRLGFGKTPDIIDHVCQLFKPAIVLIVETADILDRRKDVVLRCEACKRLQV